MPRVGLARLNNEVHTGLTLLGNYGISSVRRKKRGEITHVKHVVLGWMPAKDWASYRASKEWITTFLPKIVEGGYRLKAAIWEYTVEADVFGTGVSVPIGVVIMLTATTLFAWDYATGHVWMAYFDLLCLALPFGELWLLYRGLIGLGSDLSATSPIVGILNGIQGLASGNFSLANWLAVVSPGYDAIGSFLPVKLNEALKLIKWTP